MDNLKRTIAHNAWLKIEPQIRQAFETVPEDKLEPLTKHWGNLRLCFQIVEEMGSDRHLHLLIPRLLKKAEQDYAITFEIPDEFKKLMNSQ